VLAGAELGWNIQGAAPFDDEPLIVHVVATLQRLFTDVVVVPRRQQDLPSMPVRLVRTRRYQGPVGGIYYGYGSRSDAAL